FVLFPIALQLFREANITRVLIPGVIAAGAFTFASSCLPGAAQAAPLVAAGYLGTTITVMPVLGIVCGAFMCVLLVLYLNYALKRSQKDGLVFVDDAETTALIEKFNAMELPNFWVSLLPMVVVIVTLNLVKFPVYYSMALGVGVALAFGWKNVDNWLGTLNAGVAGAVFALINTAAANGFGGVAKITPAFADLVQLLTASTSIPPLLSIGVATTAIAGACGSGTGGLGIALGTLGPVYVDMGVSPGLIHRVALIACGGLDSLPHNGAVITCLTSCGVTHKDGYKYMGWTTVVIPLITMFFCIIVGSLGLAF
ncbi:MAG: GntP family permease, partial [Clostridiales bacterium]|nr:GntP family permease [Clostridiales bacterium]